VPFPRRVRSGPHQGARVGGPPASRCATHPPSSL
jgi:hypothetical protein